MGVADLALLEIIEGKMGWDLPEFVDIPRPTNRKRKKSESGHRG
jgi:hypothetical protein